MKLRLQRNSLRLRLGRSEVARLAESGAVEESAAFQTGTLTYRVESCLKNATPKAAFKEGTIVVHIPAETVRTWASTDEVGLYAQDGGMRIAIEKDFRCLTRAEEEPDAFPHPNI